MGETHDGIRVSIDGDTAHVWLERPEKRNAFDDRMAAALEKAFADLAARDDVRFAVLAGQGKAFCAGGDLAWMKRVAEYTPEENLHDAAAFQGAYNAIDQATFLVIGRIHGAALGGGSGLVAVCDVVVAAHGTRFGFPEVRLGLVPGVIGPYVLRRLGPGATRRLFATGDVFDAAEALDLGLVHQVVPEADLDATIASRIEGLRAASPDGVRRAKALVRNLQDAASWDAQQAVARHAIADARASDDGTEGAAAFLERRKPRWLS